MESLVGFSLIPKCMTFNDPEWLFYVKFCFRASTSSVRNFENNSVKTNKDRPTLQCAVQDSNF